MERVVMIVDWENVRNMAKMIFDDRGVKPEEAKRIFNYSLDYHIYNLCMSFVDKEGEIIEGGERLVRLLVYTAWELDEGAKRFFDEMASRGEEEKKYVDSIFKSFRRTEQIMGFLRTRRYVTLRKGVIGVKKFKLGSTEYGVHVQKRVDMLMGIDMLTYAYSGNIDGMILFLNDQDVIPAIKEVKRKGIRVSLAMFDEIINEYKKVSVPLIEHCDEIRVVSLKDLVEGKGCMRLYGD